MLRNGKPVDVDLLLYFLETGLGVEELLVRNDRGLEEGGEVTVVFSESAGEIPF